MRVATPGRVLKGHSARGDPAKFGQRTQADSVEGGAKPIRLAMLKTSLSSERCALHKGAPMEMVNFNCAAVLPGEICAHSKRKSYEKVYPPGPWELERVRVCQRDVRSRRGPDIAPRQNCDGRRAVFSAPSHRRHEGSHH